MSVVAQKIATIVRCVDRARAEYAAAGANFKQDFTRQDAALLNVMRGCEAAVDLANMLIREKRLGLPAQMKESFGMLWRANILPADLNDRLQKMIGFRNLAVHQYRDLDLDIVEAVITKNLDDLLIFAETVRAHFHTET